MLESGLVRGQVRAAGVSRRTPEEDGISAKCGKMFRTWTCRGKGEGLHWEELQGTQREQVAGRSKGVIQSNDYHCTLLMIQFDST